MDLSVDRAARSWDRAAERCAAKTVPGETAWAAGAKAQRAPHGGEATARARFSLGLAAVCRLAIIVAGAHWLAAGNALWAAVAAVALVLTFIPIIFISDLVLRDATRGVLASLLAAHVVFGMLGGLYETSAFYDKWTHLLGSGALAALGFVATRRAARGPASRLALPLRLLLVLTGTLSLGTLWELFEFSVDRTGFFTSQRGLVDTMLDLAADAAGASSVALVFVAWAHYRRRRAADGEGLARADGSLSRSFRHQAQEAK